jgi:hypothetical protein
MGLAEAIMMKVKMMTKEKDQKKGRAKMKTNRET